MSSNICIIKKRLLKQALTLEPEFADQHNNRPVLDRIALENTLKNTFKEKYQVHISMQPEHQCSTDTGNLTGKIRFRGWGSCILKQDLRHYKRFLSVLCFNITVLKTRRCITQHRLTLQFDLWGRFRVSIARFVQGEPLSHRGRIENTKRGGRINRTLQQTAPLFSLAEGGGQPPPTSRHPAHLAPAWKGSCPASPSRWGAAAASPYGSAWLLVAARGGLSAGGEQRALPGEHTQTHSPSQRAPGRQAAGRWGTPPAAGPAYIFPSPGARGDGARAERRKGAPRPPPKRQHPRAVPAPQLPQPPPGGGAWRMSLPRAGAAGPPTQPCPRTSAPSTLTSGPAAALAQLAAKAAAEGAGTVQPLAVYSSGPASSSRTP